MCASETWREKEELKMEKWWFSPEGVTNRYAHVIGVERYVADSLLRNLTPFGAVVDEDSIIGEVYQVTPDTAIVVANDLFGTVVPRREIVEAYNRISRNYLACDNAIVNDILGRFVEHMTGVYPEMEAAVSAWPKEEGLTIDSLSFFFISKKFLFKNKSLLQNHSS